MYFVLCLLQLYNIFRRCSIFYANIEKCIELPYKCQYLLQGHTAEKWGIGARRINALCLEQRIPGAFKIGNSWAIPIDAEKPTDARVKTGKYAKVKE